MNLINNLQVALVSLVICLILTPIIRRLALRTGQVSTVSVERWGKKPTPYLGGIAIFIAFICAFIIGGRSVEFPTALIAGVSIAFLVGLVDDLKKLNPATKMLGILISASIMVFGGYTTAFFPSQLPNIIISIFWIAGIANAFNLLDNMDGLAAGTIVVASLFLSYFFFQAGNEIFFIAALALFGSVLGFLFFNFPPASIYMGDSGSIFLGTLLATISIAREPQASNIFAIIAVPAMIFLLPILDTILVTITRVIRGQSFTQGGRDHSSHRLVLLGFNERQTLLILLGIAILSGLTAILVETLSYILSFFLIPLLVLSVGALFAYLGQVKISTNVDTSAVADSHIHQKHFGFDVRRRLLEVSLDFFLILFATFWADVATGSFYSGQIVQLLPIILVISFISLYIFGVYRFLWRFIGLFEVLRLGLASLFASVTAVVIMNSLYSGQETPPQFFFFGFSLILFALLTSTRISFRILGALFRRVRQAENVPVLIFGAGATGDLVLRECQGNEHLEYRIVGFVDDDPEKIGRTFYGKRVLGNTKTLQAIIEAHDVRGIIIATGIPLHQSKLNEILQIARNSEIWVRRFSMEFELLSLGS